MIACMVIVLSLRQAHHHQARRVNGCSCTRSLLMPITVPLDFMFGLVSETCATQVEAMKRRDLYRREMLLQRIQGDTQKTHEMLAARSGLQVHPEVQFLLYHARPVQSMHTVMQALP